MKTSALRKIERILLLLFSLVLVAIGVGHIIRGSVGWRNYWGGLVFAPFAISFGLLLIYVAIFRWAKLKEKTRDSKGHRRDAV
jgi:uncharacterized membrane protein